MPDAIDLELLELLSKLGALQQVVGGAKGKDQQNVVTADGKIDHFIVIRNQMTLRLSELKETLDVKSQLEKAPGSNPKELITAQSKIRTELSILQDEFKELETIYNTETKKKRSKFTPEEMKSRQQMLVKIQMEIEGIKEVKRSGYVKGYQGIQLQSMENHEMFKAGADRKNNATPDWASGQEQSRGVSGNRNNDMTHDHKMQLHQIKERDAQIVSISKI